MANKYMDNANKMNVNGENISFSTINGGRIPPTVESNKAVTIDTTTYTEPVVIKATEPNSVMSQVTVTLEP